MFSMVNVGSALVPTFALLLLTRLLAGCCAATYRPLAYTIGTSLAPTEKRGRALPLVAPYVALPLLGQTSMYDLHTLFFVTIAVVD